MIDSNGKRYTVRRRESFDDVAALYAAARPGYPQALVSDLISRSRMDKVRRVLEIGPGTGQLTVPLAKAGFSVLAVELGARLAQVLKQKLDVFSNATVVVADFDEWSAAAESFDLVVAATAFHWLDPSTRTAKCASLLRPGGALVIIETHWGAGVSGDRFALESQACYARWDPDHEPTYRPPGPEDLPRRNRELEDSGLFRQVTHKRYLCEREFSAEEYCGLLGTFSNIRAFSEQERSGFLACIRELIQRRFEGRVVRQDVYDLWCADVVA